MPVDPKQILLGKIEALKITNDAFSNVSFLNSFPSLNLGNPLSFLTDLFKLLFGQKRMKNDFIRFLMIELAQLEKELLAYFKKSIVEYYFCKLDALIPNKFFVEFNFKIHDIDFFGMLKVDPTTDLGKHYYENYVDNLDKTLYQTIHTSGVHNWKHILNLRYENGLLFVRLDDSLKGKTIYDFVNMFFTGLVMYDHITIVSDLVDGVFGTLSNLHIFSKKNIEDGLKFEVLLDKILDNAEVNDSFYTFDSESLNDQVNQKKNGYFKYVDCDTSYVQYPQNDLSGFINDLNHSELTSEIYSTNFGFLVDKTSPQVFQGDKSNYEGNLFTLFFRNVTKSIVKRLFSPQKVLFIRIFAKMAASVDGNFNLIEFIKSHKNFILDIVKKKIEQAILHYLLAILEKELTSLIIQGNVKKEQEQLNNYKLQIQSLIGFGSL